MKKRLTMLLSAAAVSAVLLAGGAVYADGGNPNMMTDTGVLTESANTENTQTVYYGTRERDGNMVPCPWLVVGYNGSGVAGRQRCMTLIAADNLGMTYFNSHGNRINKYKDSMLQGAMDGLAENLSAGEKAVIAKRTLVSGTYVEYDEETGTATDYVAGDPVENAVLWPLSSAEATVLRENHRKVDPEHPDWGSSYWWLRSPGSAAHKAAYVKGDGAIDYSGYDYGDWRSVDNDRGVRPAFHLDDQSVLFVSAATGGKQSYGVGNNAVASIDKYTGNEWKLTVKDSRRDDFRASFVKEDKGNWIIDYSGAVTGDNEYISALVIKDTGEIVDYGRIEALEDESEASGTVRVDLPLGAFTKGATVYVINEQYNGDKRTDYSSNPVKIKEIKMIDHMDLKIAAPICGRVAIADRHDQKNKPVVTIPASGGYELNPFYGKEGAYWVNDDNQYLAFSFTAGESYHAVVDLRAQAGYFYGDSCEVTVNGRKEDRVDIASNRIGCTVDTYLTAVHDLHKLPGKAATCTKEGERAAYLCSECGRMFADSAGKQGITADDLVIPAKGHHWDAGKVSGNSLVCTCTDCGVTKKESLEEAVGPGASAEAADTVITSMKSDTDPAGSVFAKLQLRSPKQTKDAVTLSWAKTGGAKKYVIYGNKCGPKNKCKKLAEVTGRTKVFKKVAGKKVKKGTYYKFIAVAVDKNGRVISTSRLIHVATKGGKVGNHKSVTVSKKVLAKAKQLKKGKSLKLAARAVAQSRKKPVKKHVAVRYESTNKKVATVTAKGVVKAKKKGTAYVYAYAQNGVFKKIKITVK